MNNHPNPQLLARLPLIFLGMAVVMGVVAHFEPNGEVSTFMTVFSLLMLVMAGWAYRITRMGER